MKPVDVNLSMYIDFNKENNEVGANIKVKDIFEKGYSPNWSEEDFMIEKKLKTLSRGQKTNQKEFRVEKLLKRKSHNCILDGTPIIIFLTVGLIKKTYYE